MDRRYGDNFSFSVHAFSVYSVLNCGYRFRKMLRMTKMHNKHISYLIFGYSLNCLILKKYLRHLVLMFQVDMIVSDLLGSR